MGWRKAKVDTFCDRVVLRIDHVQTGMSVRQAKTLMRELQEAIDLATVYKIQQS